MRTFTIFIVAVAAVSNGVELGTENGKLVARREQAVEVFELSQMVSEVSNFIASPMGPAAIVMSDMTSRTMGLQSAATANTVRLDMMESRMENTLQQMTSTMTAGMSSMTATMTAQANAMSAAMSSQASTIDARIDDSIYEMSSALTEMNRSNTESMGLLSERLTRTTSQGVAAASTAITMVNSSLVSAMDKKMDNTGHIWNGGCSSSAGGGWHDYCLNRVEMDTAAPYFRKASNTRFRSIQAMYFHFTFYALKRSRGWSYMLLYINGNHRIHTNGYYWNPWQSSNWYDDYAYITYGIAANQEFYARSYAQSWTAYHSYGHHSRLSVQWIGKK